MTDNTRDPLIEWFRAWTPEAAKLVAEFLEGGTPDDR